MSLLARELLARPGVSTPRRIVPGASYLVTRRCSERRFFLRPGPEVNAIILYCLALAATRYGILLHAYGVLSNHYHFILTDPQGVLPLFEHDFDSLVARALNARYGHFENFWSSGTYSAVLLTDRDSVLEKMAYVLANPVSAGLVCRSDLWPGLIARPGDLGAPPRTVCRPPQFFRQEGATALPAEVTLELVVPPGFEGVALDEVRELVSTRQAEHEDRARRERKGRPFLGRRGVLHQRIADRPRDDEQHFELNPRVAGRDKWRRIEALGRLRNFVAAYRLAWRQLQAGFRSAVFPAGTWKLRRELGVWCEAPS
jgi:REP element-mobilizing transposase RayT